MKKIVLCILISFTLIFILLLTIRPRPEQLQRYLVHPAPKALDDDLTVQFLGNTNLLFSDGKTSILTDGFLRAQTLLRYYLVRYPQIEKQ